MRFLPPAPEESLGAIGPVVELTEPLLRAFTPGDDFDPVPPPGPSDWLAHHTEEGQTFDAFVESAPNRPDAQRQRLYLQPLGAFAEDASPPLERLRAFAAAFFMMDVVVLPLLDPAAIGVTRRHNPQTGHGQVLTGDLLAYLERDLPADAFAVLGITMEDLYPDPAWSFVFGQASLRRRVGVYSFARYDPRFFGEPPPPDLATLMLYRSCKVLAHETTHMFGIRHCIFYHCLMNGSNHLAESDARPLHLCPVDLRKLHASIGFDVAVRYRRLQELCAAWGFEEDAAWFARRLARLEAVAPGGPLRPAALEDGLPQE